MIIVDSAQEEYRLLMGLAGQEDKLRAIARKEDPYEAFAAIVYRCAVDAVNPAQRRFGKAGVLGLGYGMGREKFWRVCQSQKLDVTREETDEAVNVYRKFSYRAVSALWYRNDERLRILAHLGAEEIIPGALWLEDGYVCLPNGLRVKFKLRWDSMTESWVRTTRYGEIRYWGGALTEFFCQALARVVLSDTMLQVNHELKLRPCLLVHDELVYMVNKDGAEEYLKWVCKFMSGPIKWWPTGPIMGAEGRVANDYGKV
ncbi:MAG: DNA polymerase, partial [Nitrososphaera sp.]|nr:DNA polymerase [Nitrososphaera sp.]